MREKMSQYRECEDCKSKADCLPIAGRWLCEPCEDVADMAATHQPKEETEMKVTAYVFKTNGVVTTMQVSGMREIQQVTGGYFEIVMNGPGWCLYGNESGRSDMLPMNEPARMFVAGKHNVPMGSIISLHGDMILVGTNDEGGNAELDEGVADNAERCQMYDPGEITITTFD